MKKFDIPNFYRSSFIAKIKALRKENDPRKRDFQPTILDFGPLRIHLARHFGFCYGVENAVEIAYKALEENPDKRVFLLSEMIHNPGVNLDLERKGIRHILSTKGEQLVDWEEISNEDIVITPAFGTTLEIEQLLRDKGIIPENYDTTCPFVVKVWKTSSKLGDRDFTVIIHGKPKHEETRATFSHSSASSPSLIVRNLEEAKVLASFMLGVKSREEFDLTFKDRGSFDFDPDLHLDRLGVVNQTTMLASDTHEIAQFLKDTLLRKFGEEKIKEHFADTRDTLCYATNDNQRATFGLLEVEADLAFVVGGYNSSNTSHIVELCEQALPTYFISSASEIISREEVHHFDYPKKQHLVSKDYIPESRPLRVIITSGASCPDSSLDGVLDKLLSFFPEHKSKESVLETVISSHV